MPKNDEKTQFTKIDIDDETHEPSIVVVSENELPAETQKKKKELPDVVLKNPKQIKMTEVIGFETDKSINKRKRIIKNVITHLFAYMKNY